MEGTEMSEKYVAQDQNPKFVGVNYLGPSWNLSLTYFYVQDIGRQQWLTCCWFVRSYRRMYRYFHRMYAPKTAWDRAQRRGEGELNFIRQSRAFKQWKRTKRSIQAPWYTTFHTFQKGRQKMAGEPKEPGICFGKPLIGACWWSGTHVGRMSFRCEWFRNTLKSISFQR